MKCCVSGYSLSFLQMGVLIIRVAPCMFSIFSGPIPILNRWLMVTTLLYSRSVLTQYMSTRCHFIVDRKYLSVPVDENFRKKS